MGLRDQYQSTYRRQWRIQDFPQAGALTSEIDIIFQIFAENCMKMKCASLAPPPPDQSMGTGLKLELDGETQTRTDLFRMYRFLAHCCALLYPTAVCQYDSA